MIKALSGIRFYLFLLILATHVKFIIKGTRCGDILFPYLNQGGFAVLFFFILSGFCIVLGYAEKFQKLCIDDIKYFYLKRLIKLYPLYILTGLIFLVYNMANGINSLSQFLLLYIPMISPFTKNFDGGGNAAAWFIAVIFFCYLLSPVFLYLLNIVKGKYFYLFFVNWFLLIIFAILFKFLHFSNELYTYWYHFPPYRFLHFLLGLNLGFIYKDYLSDKINFILKKSLYKSILDIIFLIIFICSMFIFNKGFLSTNIILSLLFSIIIIYLCNENSSILNFILTNKMSLYLSNISMECYLIHYIFCIIAQRYFAFHPLEFSYINILFLYFIILLITILLSSLYKKLENKISITVAKNIK